MRSMTGYRNQEWNGRKNPTRHGMKLATTRVGVLFLLSGPCFSLLVYIIGSSCCLTLTLSNWSDMIAVVVVVFVGRLGGL